MKLATKLSKFVRIVATNTAIKTTSTGLVGLILRPGAARSGGVAAKQIRTSLGANLKGTNARTRIILVLMKAARMIRS